MASLSCLKETSLHAQNEYLVNTDSILNDLNAKAKIAFKNGDYDKSRELLEKVLDLKLKYYSDQKKNLANTYSNLAVAYRNIWEFENAIELSLKAIELYSSVDSSNINIGKILSYINYLYINIGDYEKAQQYFNYSILFNKNFGHKDDENIINFSRGTLYDYLKEHENARKSWSKCENIAEYKFPVYNSLALSYIKTNDIENAEKYYNLIFKLPNLKAQEMYMVYLNYGIFLYEHKHDLQKALHYFDLALKTILTYNPQNTALISQIYHNYGEVYLNDNKLPKSLDYFQKALITGSINFKETGYLSNPSLDQITNLSRIYTTLKFKARALRKYYFTHNDIRFLKSSLEVSGICFDIINKMRYRISSEGSLFSISENEKDVYTEAISTAFHLYNLTGEKEYLDKAFQINEMSKAFVLLVHLRTLKAMRYGNIPDELIVKERELHRKLSLYEEQVLLEKQKKVQDEQRMKTWEELIAKYNMEYDLLLRKFEKDFPDYYDLKYRTEYISPTEITSKLRKNDAVIEYVLSGNSLYTFIITKDSSGFYRHEVSNKLEQECNEYYKLITTQSFYKNIQNTYQNFTKQGYHLYKMLLEPFEEIIKDKNLIIIADGEISYLPFDALLTIEVNNDSADYRTLPYLLHKHSVGFSYSSTLHFKHGIKNKAKNKAVLAFAPEYGNIRENKDSQQGLNDEDRYNLIVLPGIKDEVKNIGKYLDVDIYQDSKALESNFKRLASDYEILHLAMHTILDDKNPFYSKMAFTQYIDKEDDGFLHAFEVYNMQLNANLVVLSSCSSGFGKLQEGEGMQSLARSFSYAGCPSILMTLWEVADNATVEMMDSFYKYLIQGYSKPEALRLSKLDFVKKADLLKSNPFFWSGFIILGDSFPLFSEFKIKSFGIYVIPLLILGVIIALRVRHVKSKRKFYSWYIE